MAKVPQQIDAKLMIQRGAIWFARMAVPKDVQPALGRTVYQKSTGEADFGRAYAKALPWIDGWKAEIKAARGANATGVADLIATARAQFAAEKEREGGDAWAVAEGLIERLERDGHIPMSKDASGRAHDAIATPIVEQVMGLRTPLDVAKAKWIALDLRTMQPRQADQYRRDLEVFLEAHASETVESLSGRKVQGWIDKLATVDGLAGATIQRKLAVMRGYWKRLEAEQYVKDDHKPFHDRTIPQRPALPGTARMAFTPQEVTRLRDTASGPLRDLISLAAFTGARIEELYSLKADDVHGEGRSLALRIVDAKTDAGDRQVPVHSSILDLVTRLRDAPAPGGYLLPSSSSNQYKERSVASGKQFGRLKTAQGFGPAHVFHSFRKTVATLFENAECPEGIAADILGHEKPTMTYGLYSGGSSMETRRSWIERALVYPGL